VINLAVIVRCALTASLLPPVAASAEVADPWVMSPVFESGGCAEVAATAAAEDVWTATVAAPAAAAVESGATAAAAASAGAAGAGAALAAATDGVIRCFF